MRTQLLALAFTLSGCLESFPAGGPASDSGADAPLDLGGEALDARGPRLDAHTPLPDGALRLDEGPPPRQDARLLDSEPPSDARPPQDLRGRDSALIEDIGPPRDSALIEDIGPPRDSALIEDVEISRDVALIEDIALIEDVAQPQDTTLIEDAAILPPDVALIEDAAIPLPDEINAGWIGAPCQDNEDCVYEDDTEGFCLREREGFPGGLCSARCTPGGAYCPDHPDIEEPPEGAYSLTFCVTDAEGEGTCVPQVNDIGYPEGDGCREGYASIEISRHDYPEVLRFACLPGGAPLHALQHGLNEAALEAQLGDARIALFDLSVEPFQYAHINGHEPIDPDSVIKVAVMAEGARQDAEHEIDWNDEFTIQATDLTCTRDDGRPELELGTVEEMDNLVGLMISRSDNTATNALIRRFGLGQITDYMALLGLPGIQVRQSISGCGDSPLWDEARGNTMTAWEAAVLYQLILKDGENFAGGGGHLGKQQDFLGAQLYSNGIREALPQGAEYLSKTSTLPNSSVTHDSGIIIWGDEEYVLAVFTERAPAQGAPLIEAFGAALTRLMGARRDAR